MPLGLFKKWQYVLSGKMRLTVFAYHGLAKVVELGAGDIGFARVGYSHALENVGDGPAELILVFKSGEYQKTSVSMVLAAHLAYLLETNFNLSKAIIGKLPQKQEFNTSGGRVCNEK
jgi:oxalate decarboxylase